MKKHHIDYWFVHYLIDAREGSSIPCKHSLSAVNRSSGRFYNSKNALPSLLFSRLLTSGSKDFHFIDSSFEQLTVHQPRFRQRESDVQLSKSFSRIPFLSQGIVIVESINYQLNNYLDKFSISAWSGEKKLSWHSEVMPGYR